MQDIQDLLQKYNMYHGKIVGDVVKLTFEGKPVKYTTVVEKMFEEMRQKNPNIVIELTSQSKELPQKFILNKDGWFYLRTNGKIKHIKKKTVAIMIYKLSKGNKHE